MSEIPKEHIDLALKIESEVPDSKWDLYMECMNNKPMSERTTDIEIRDGCILTHNVYLACVGDEDE